MPILVLFNAAAGRVHRRLPDAISLIKGGRLAGQVGRNARRTPRESGPNPPARLVLTSSLRPVATVRSMWSPTPCRCRIPMRPGQRLPFCRPAPATCWLVTWACPWVPGVMDTLLETARWLTRSHGG